MRTMEEALWAKKHDKNGEFFWLPLKQHLFDTQHVMGFLWDIWLGSGQRELIEAYLSDATKGKELAQFLGAIHDLGKSIPAFQQKKSYQNSPDLDKLLLEQLCYVGFDNMDREMFASANDTPHNIASQVLLKEYGVGDDIGAIIGGHHGRPVDMMQIIDNQLKGYRKNYFQSEHVNTPIYQKWERVQRDIFEWALQSSGFSSVQELPTIKQPAQVILSGLLIMADWIASNENYFPLFPVEKCEEFTGLERVRTGCGNWLKSYIWQPEIRHDIADIFNERFGEGEDEPFVPREFQHKLCGLIQESEEPGIYIVEAPMGQGKTEAALVGAELLAQKTGRNGIFFGLPTQATSDGIFSRVLRWLERLDDENKNLMLMHGKAQLNTEFANLAREVDLDDEHGTVFINQWFSGKKSAILTDFVVGTVDHFLMVALKQKHLALRHLGFSKKVVIIDEVHAYDAFMDQYMLEAITWMGAYGVPLIILSATLPQAKRFEMLQAYLKGKGKIFKRSEREEWQATLCTEVYPLITYTDGQTINQCRELHQGGDKHVQIIQLNEADLMSTIQESLNGGGVMGIIVNTVNRAQELAKELSEIYGENIVEVLHSRFIDTDRKEKEKQLLNTIGKNAKRPARKIIVGTQVIEQSLDINFDVMISELAPMDLLLQRMGRLHRHNIRRPAALQEPKFYVTGIHSDLVFNEGSSAIYGDYLLARTQYYLPNSLNLPEDISILVQKVYDFDKKVSFGDELQETYLAAKKQYLELIEQKKDKAKNYQLDDPILKESISRKGNLIGWLKNITPEQSEEYAYAQVRDTKETLEVIAVKRCETGYALFSNMNEDISNQIHSHHVAREVAKHTLKLPTVLSVYGIDQTIRELEDINRGELREWQTSLWLKGSLGIIFDSNNQAEIRGYRLTYDTKYGLTAERIGVSE